MQQDPKARERLDHIRHTLSHLLATAVLEKYPDAHIAIGPTIEHGFYYDIDAPNPIKPDDLPKLENRMRELIAAKLRVEKVRIGKFEDAGPAMANNRYKEELYRELKQQKQPATFYKIGSFVDLCRGGHVENTGDINPTGFKLTKVAGAYWRGDSTKAMLQRVYGVAFDTKEELDRYLALIAEAEKRDHRTIGHDLELFAFDAVAPGAPFWLPNGMTLIRELERYWREIHDAAGYLETSTPILSNASLYKTSGHWEHFRENMFTLVVDDQDFALKPMNCPSSTIIYTHDLRSYRDLPLRYSEIGRLHRNEVRGTLGGLLRVRQITMDDAHIFCRPDQIEQEIRGVLRLVVQFYSLFDLTPTFKLSTMPDQHLGEEKTWKQAEQTLEHVLKSEKLSYELNPKEGAFYGPKIDIEVNDALQRTWQVATIQLDYQMPERFKLSYMDKDGHQQRPVMIHRAIFGSYERFIGILLEHLAGRLPTWLAPVQVQLIPVGSDHVKPCDLLSEKLRSKGIRVSVDSANETVGYKIRKAEKMRIPYMLVIGDREAKSTKLQVRIRGKKDVVAVVSSRFGSRIKREITQRALTPKP
ncbi:MAG: threonine--tRNA ligase [Candidatus Kerfeldbacteria bacterium]